MGGKWLSGRKRQTVNLLGNSRWFESNLSHKKYMLAKIPNNRSKAIKIRRRFNTINKYIYSLGIKSNNKQIMNNTSNNENIITPVLDMLYELKIPSYSIIKNKFNVYKLIIRENISSLGIISKRFSDKKSYLKSKSSYIMSSSYARR